MPPVIRKYKIQRFPDGTHLCPPQFTNPRNQANNVENQLYTDWMDEDASIMMWIHSTISVKVIAYFSNCSTYFQLWSSITARFARSSTTHSIQLRTKLLAIKQGDKSIPTLINEIESLSDQLAATGEIISDQELVVVTLAALNSDYIPFATSVRHRYPPITSIELENNLLSEEAVVSDRNAHLITESSNKAFAANMHSFRPHVRGTGGRFNSFTPNFSRGFGRSGRGFHPGRGFYFPGSLFTSSAPPPRPPPTFAISSASDTVSTSNPIFVKFATNKDIMHLNVTTDSILLITVLIHLNISLLC